MRVDDFDIDKLIEDLRGTCKSISDFLPEGMEEEDLTEEETQHLDQEIFLCAECGWWCEQSQSTDKEGENVCNDCNEENED